MGKKYQGKENVILTEGLKKAERAFEFSFKGQSFFFRLRKHYSQGMEMRNYTAHWGMGCKWSGSGV